jgi:hypothetical protein
MTMKKLIAVLAATMIGTVAFAQDTTVIKKEDATGSKTVVKKRSVGCKSKTIHKTNDMGESKTIHKTKC